MNMNWDNKCHFKVNMFKMTIKYKPSKLINVIVTKITNVTRRQLNGYNFFPRLT